MKTSPPENESRSPEYHPSSAEERPASGALPMPDKPSLPPLKTREQDPELLEWRQELL